MNCTKNICKIILTSLKRFTKELLRFDMKQKLLFWLENIDITKINPNTLTFFFFILFSAWVASVSESRMTLSPVVTHE